MAIFYLDTSAILKRYRTEKGTDAARALKGKLLTKRAYDVLLGSFSNDIGESLLLLAFSGEMVNDAIDAVRRFSLRAPDAIHLVSAAIGGRQLTGGAFVFVASDRELLVAAQAAGMTTLDPEANDSMERLRQLRALEKSERQNP